MYTILEFTFYETILAAIVNYSKTQSITHHGEGAVEIIDEHAHARQRNMAHVMLSAFLAGGISAVILNPLEYLLAHTQNSKNKSILEIIKSTPNIRGLWKGVHFSTMHYGCTAMLLFVVLEKV